MDPQFQFERLELEFPNIALLVFCRYILSLQWLRITLNEQVAELSEPSSPELKEVIHSVVHGLLATLSPKMHSMAPPHMSENASTGTLNVGIEEDCFDLVENTSLQFHPLISLSRDYLARLLFWLDHFFSSLLYSVLRICLWNLNTHLSMLTVNMSVSCLWERGESGLQLCFWKQQWWTKFNSELVKVFFTILFSV